MDLPSHREPAVWQWLSRLAPVVFVATVACVAWRITRGVDLTDESYYAIFIDDWLKEGIARSPFLLLHQVCALIVYPAALAYRAMAGSSAGLILFLRCLYLLGSTLSALALVQFLKRTGTGSLRWISGAILVAFIPYGLPAPSYNTIGCQAFILACATFGSAVLAAERGERTRVHLIASAVAWALALMAYPSLLLPLAALLAGMVFIVRPRGPFTLTYLSAVAASQAVAWALVLWALGWRRIADSVAYQSTVAATFDAHYVLARLTESLPRSPVYALVLVLAVGVGSFRRQIPLAVAAVVESLLILSVRYGPPALYVASHDAVVVAALGGVALLGGFRRPADRRAKLMAVLYAVAWFGGLGMASTATYGLFKIPVGAVLAAAIAVTAIADRCIAAGHPRLAPIQAATLLGVLLAVSFQSYYGEPPGTKSVGRVRITGSVFSGLAVSANDRGLIEVARGALRQHERPGDTIAVLGPFPGLYLLSDAHVRAPSAFPLTPMVQPSGHAANRAYYARPENRPSLVLLLRAPNYPLVNPFDPNFDTWYSLRERYPTPYGALEIFRRTDG